MFISLLSKNPYQLQTDEPSCFKDLNLDLIVNAITDGSDELSPYFYTALECIDDISYRQDVLKDLENDHLYKTLEDDFKDIMYFETFLNKAIESMEADDFRNNRLVRSKFLYRSIAYLNTLSQIKTKLSNAKTKSEGLEQLKHYIQDYLSSPSTKILEEKGSLLINKFSNIKFMMHIHNGKMRILDYKESGNLSTDVNHLFSKFENKSHKNLMHSQEELITADHIESQVLDILADKHKQVFTELNKYCDDYINSFDIHLHKVAKEFSFYSSYLSFIENRCHAISFSYPLIQEQSNTTITSGVNLSIALLKSSIPNDFSLDELEKIAVITGPNQGGKTSYARMIGQIYYLGMLGLKVPAKFATLPYTGSIYTHFNTEENLASKEGKLKDDIIRLKSIMDIAKDDDLIIVNEIYSSTTYDDALILSEKMLMEINQLASTFICVTFIDSLSNFNNKTVSYVCDVDEQLKLTFTVHRSKANGLAYALDIASKYQLTYDQLKRRLPC